MRYPGGKGRAYQRIINLMPPHRVYLETHLGGGAVLRHKKPAARSIGVERDPAVVRRWRERPLNGVEVMEGDAVAFLRSFTFQGDELIYSDPPYVSATRRRGRCYRFDYEDDDHIALLETLKCVPCAVMVSGYPSELYDRHLAGWRTHALAVATHKGLRTEIIWSNFEPPERLHDHRYLGNDFRVRERVRRRIDRWVGRLEQLPPLERNAVVSAITDRFLPNVPARRITVDPDSGAAP